MSDARERLRRYLEQRRELGESEFVLDSLSVEDALKVLAFGATPPGPTDAGAGRTGAAGGAAAGSGAGGGASRAAERPIPPAADSAKRRAAEEAAKGGDWREALRAVDAAQEPTPAASPPRKGTRAPSESAEKKEIVLEQSSAASAAPTKSAPAKATPPADPISITVGTGAPASGLDHLRTLDDVAKAIAGCTACDLHATALNPVPGEGNPAAKFVVVGEAPGATEDELGRPFVGRSGDLLTKILEAIGFKREDVFICNVLKHRPPGNRNPTVSEIAACRPFLLRQLEILQPRVVLALGTFAAQTLLATDTPIGKLRGIEHSYHGIPLIATYHPAAMLRNPNWKRPAWEDVQFARRIFDRA